MFSISYAAVAWEGKYHFVLSPTAKSAIFRLVAILLGRLKLSAEEALDKYHALASVVFAEPLPSGLFDHEELEKALRKLVAESETNSDAKMVESKASCRT